MNKITLKGRLTSKPELKQTTTGITVANFTVAVNRRFNKEQTDFINCQAWKTTAEFVNKYFDKGQEILVVGELHIEKWEKDGETRTASRVVIDEVEFCGSKKDNAKSTTDDATTDDGFEEIADDGDYPF